MDGWKLEEQSNTVILYLNEIEVAKRVRDQWFFMEVDCSYRTVTQAERRVYESIEKILRSDN